MNNIELYIKRHIEGSINAIEQISSKLTNPIQQAAEIITNAFFSKNKLLIAGNGGSAADAQHIAAELIIRLDKNIKRKALPAIALTTDTSILTAGSNDFGYDSVLMRQIEALGNENDIFFAISTSGNSPNIVKALYQAKKNKLKSIALLGNNGGEIKFLADLPIVVEDNNTQHIQEAHICIYHLICELVEKSFLNISI